MLRQFRFWVRKRWADSCSCPWVLSVCCRSVYRGFRQGLNWENVFSLSLPRQWNGAQRKTSGSMLSTTNWEINGASFPTIFRRSMLPITQKRQLDKKSLLLTPQNVDTPFESPPLEIIPEQAGKNARYL